MRLGSQSVFACAGCIVPLYEFVRYGFDVAVATSGTWWKNACSQPVFLTDHASGAGSMTSLQNALNDLCVMQGSLKNKVVS